MTKAGGISALPFMKMHGAGNDFVVIDGRGRDPVVTTGLARALGDRHRGVGFDQLAEIRDSAGTTAALSFWNADGSTSAACGNATRCIADYLMRASSKSEITLATERGILTAVRNDTVVSVNMGQPQLSWGDIPLSQDVDTLHLPVEGDPVAVGMGNPHAVFFVEDIAEVDVAGQGKAFEHHALFPLATNVEFVQVRGRTDLRMRVWERGTGITLACGSGACAAAVAAHRRGLADRTLRIELDGGWLGIDWRDDGVWMSGPTAHVFDGMLPAAFLESVS
ncbi:MAG: diaminopimelate epimerase [Pseudomonadota bacterium]